MARLTLRLAAVAAALTVAGIAGPPASARQTTLTPEQHVAALKQSLASSQKQLRQYEWIETTVISLKGEEKARKQNRCYYGAEGKIQKTPIGDAPQQQAQQQRGRRGGRVMQQIAENKKDEMQEYMERAVTLIHSYLPPTGDRIQAARDAGRMSVTPLGKGQVRLEFADYLQKGDKLGIAVNSAADRLMGLDVATYLDKPEEAVTVAVRMGTLADGAVFNEQITLDAAAKHIKVVIQNSGYRPMGR